MAPASTAIYPLSLHDALPICHFEAALGDAQRPRTVLEAADIEPLLPEPHAFAFRADAVARWYAHVLEHDFPRSEEHTSELQSLRHLVCRLLLEKKKEIM